VVDHDVVAETAVEHVRHRVRVGDHGDRFVTLLAFEKLPGICPLLVAPVQRALEREAAGGDERVPDSKDPRLTRLVQIETARIVPGENAERHDINSIEGREAEHRASLAAVGIVHERQHRVDEQRVASRAGVRILCGDGAITAERVHRNQDERGRRDDGDGQYASGRPIRRAAQAELRDRPPSAARQSPARRPSKPQCQRAHGGGEERGACPEEGAGFVHPLAQPKAQ